MTAAHASTRSRAQVLIREGKVSVDGKVVTKPGTWVEASQQIKLLEADHPFVSRGGLKLAHALEYWHIDVKGWRCLDVGASTGGFTDCLLQQGAAEVVAVDVGTDQMHERLRGDKRIRLFEQTHIKNFSLLQLGNAVELVVVDVSFISLKQVLPFLPQFLRTTGKLIALLKPQFELGPQNLDARGIVKEPRLYENLQHEMREFFLAQGWQGVEIIESPVKGGDGNREFLVLGARS